MESDPQAVEARTATAQEDTTADQSGHQPPKDTQSPTQSLAPLCKLPHKVSLSPGTVEPYISDVEERWELVEEYRRVQELRMYGGFYIGSDAIAAFMLVPIPILQQHLERASEWWETVPATTVTMCARFAIEYASKLCRPYPCHDEYGLIPQNMPPEIETPLASPLASDINCSDKETKLHSRDDDGMSGMGAPPRKIQKTSPSPSQPHTATAQLPDTLAPTSRVVSPTERADDEETSSHGKDAAELAKTRDGNRCFLTGDCDPDIVQIIPLSPEARHRATGFIGLVRLLYDGEQFPPWIHLLLNRSVVQTQNNLLCLSKHMRDLWSKCFFALKPVAATDQEVTVQFHWLKHNTGITPDHYGLYDYDFAMQAVCDGDTHGWGPPQAARLPDGNLIETGQLFTIRAEPDQLPNTDLLQLQWYWKRMSAMIADSEVYFRFERRGYSGYSDSDQETDAATDQGSISSEGDSEESEKW